MMRSWGNRPDTFVCDEPLYAHYLLKTQAGHPGADEVIRRHETDWRKVTQWLTHFEPAGKSVFYQKHMSHHMLADIDYDWLAELSHGFLIREPLRVIRSFTRIAGEPELEATGLPQQLRIFRRSCERTGRVPPVVDARDVLEHPERTLSALCDAFGVDFEAGMLAWPAGPRDTDGAWGQYWYDTVSKSTGFHSYEPDDEPVPRHLEGLLQAADEIYQELYRHRLRP